MQNPSILRYAVVTIVFFISGGLAAQHLQAYNEAMQFMNQRDYQKAIVKLRESITYNDRFADSWYYLGMCYSYLQDYESQIDAFQNLSRVNPNYNPWYLFEASKALIKLNRFSEAEGAAQQFLQRFQKGPTSTSYEHFAKNRMVYARESPGIRSQPPSTSNPIPLTRINSIAGDYSPQVSPTGTNLYFTSVRKGGFDHRDDTTQVNNWGEDIYFANLIDSVSWSEPKLMPPPINSYDDDFGAAFTGDGQTMVYVRCGDKGGVGNCDLYITQLVGTQWSNPENMGNVVNSNTWESQPTISSDGNKIIFSSIREGGYGGADLYMVEKNHLGDWGIPQNLGSTVNTPFNDNSPYLAADGKTLYYSTEGHPGYGGADIFYCNFDNGKWSKPINIGAPVNSDGDDTNFSISASGMAYFSSSRMDLANYDIYQVELPDHLKPKPTVVIQGLVTNARDSSAVGALVLIEDINTGELIAINKSNSASGEYLVVLPAGRNYSVSVTSEGFFFYSQSFELPKDTSYQEIIMDIALEPIEKGIKVVLNNIFFESGRAELKPISYVELNKAVTLMKENPTMVIEVGGHTDNIGSDELNMKLSQSRAESVVEYLVLAGIDRPRLQAKGYGETQPLEDNATEEGRSANRRTEFVIVEF